MAPRDLGWGWREVALWIQKEPKLSLAELFAATRDDADSETLA